MRIVIFCHSLLSDWNHGNAHFLRGLVGDLVLRGHEVRALEPHDSWSYCNLVRCHGAAAVAQVHGVYPLLNVTRYKPDLLDLEAELDGVDLIVVHEWNDPALVAALGDYRRSNTACRILFHDTHHRSATDPESMARYDLSAYDGVLAFGQVIRDIYIRNGWAKKAWVFHEAADVRVFQPMRRPPTLRDLVWIGNWGDGERSAELKSSF